MAVKHNNSLENDKKSGTDTGSGGSETAPTEESNSSKRNSSTSSQTSNNNNNKVSLAADEISIQKPSDRSSSSEESGESSPSPPPPQQQRPVIHILVDYFYNIAYNPNSLIQNTSNIIFISNHLLVELSNCPLPKEPEPLKTLKEDIQKVAAIFAKVAEINPQYFNLIYLRQVAQIIAANRDENDSQPSCLIAIIFQLFSEDDIPKAVSYIYTGNSDIPNDDLSIFRTVKLLSSWLRQCNFCSNLNIWILAILNLLREQRKFDLLLAIVGDIIEPLVIALIVPILRPKVYPIIFHTLTSIKDKPIIFHKIIGRAPRVLKQIKKELHSNENEESRKIFQELIDVIAALIEHFPGYDALYREMNELLSVCRVSHNYRNLLENQIWTTDNITRPESNFSNPKVGLINLGNTCYMNSVLQALVMTKDFCAETLLTDATEIPFVLHIQRLFAQMLYSKRPEITPIAVLQESRPRDFILGYQQDSFEFLGFFFETFHEQQRNLLIRKLNKNQKSIENKPLSSSSSSKPGPSSSSVSSIINDCPKMEIDSEESSSTSPIQDDNQHHHHHHRIIVSTSQINDTVMKTTTTNTAVSSPKIIISSPTNTISQSQSPSSPTSSSSSNNYDGNADDDDNHKKFQTIIDQLFTGKITTTYKCLKCDFKSKKTDTFRDFPLSFPDIKNDIIEKYTIQELVEFYCSTEQLNGDNQYFCEKCKILCDGERYMNVNKAPKNLILTLKQFKYDQNNHVRTKLLHKVFYDEKLILKIFNSTKDNDNNVDNDIDNLNYTLYQYELYAAVIHSGYSMDSGHYYTYATDNINSINHDNNDDDDDTIIQWYKFNDSFVTKCNKIELHRLNPPNTPYILFYRMQSKQYINKTKNSQHENNHYIDEPKFDLEKLPKLNELPSNIKDMINEDNLSYKNELKLRELNKNSTIMNKRNQNDNYRGGRNNDDDDDDDNDQQPPPNNCGDNSFNMNTNKFIY